MVAAKTSNVLLQPRWPASLRAGMRNQGHLASRLPPRRCAPSWDHCFSHVAII